MQRLTRHRLEGTSSRVIPQQRMQQHQHQQQQHLCHTQYYHKVSNAHTYFKENFDIHEANKKKPVQDEGLKNLMMSWYYAGYYTGLYEGQQRANKTDNP